MPQSRIPLSSLALLLLLGLAACGNPANIVPHPALALPVSAPLTGRWTGETRPESSSGPVINGQICDGPTRAMLDVLGRNFVLAPNEGVLVLYGTVDPSGHLAATLVLHPGGNQITTLTFTGQVTGDRIEGLLTTPRCHAQVILHRGS
jgi:hypothetical protein